MSALRVSPKPIDVIRGGSTAYARHRRPCKRLADGSTRPSGQEMIAEQIGSSPACFFVAQETTTRVPRFSCVPVGRHEQSPVKGLLLHL